MGQSESHLASFDGGVLVHREVVAPLRLLQERAERDGVELKVASGFRGFETQLNIWNQKAQGKRKLLDSEGRPLDFQKLSEDEIISAILRWSALPGASRHHWGTDLDVFDAKALKKGVRLQLVPQEAAPGGPFAEFSRWLGENLLEEKFFRPYSRDLGGVSPEWWHISFEPVSKPYFEKLSLSLLEKTLAATELEKKNLVLKRLPEIYKKYIVNITQ